MQGSWQQPMQLMIADGNVNGVPRGTSDADSLFADQSEGISPKPPRRSESSETLASGMDAAESSKVDASPPLVGSPKKAAEPALVESRKPQVNVVLARSTGVAAKKPADVKDIIDNMKTARAKRLSDAASDKGVAEKGDAADGEGDEDAGMPVRKRPSAFAGGAKASKQLKSWQQSRQLRSATKAPVTIS